MISKSPVVKPGFVFGAIINCKIILPKPTHWRQE